MAPVPQDDAVLSQLEFFDVGFERGISLNYQTWKFPYQHRVSFLTSQGPAERRQIILQAMDLARRIVRADILATLPEIERTVGGGEAFEALKLSLEESRA